MDTAWMRRSFDSAAASFDAAAVLHAQVRVELLERLELANLAPRVVLDAGAATGHASRALKKRYPHALVLALDSSPRMLRAARRQQAWLRRFACVCANAEQLPLRAGSVDLIVSNLMLQWCDPDALFEEFQRVLAPQGLLAFTSFGPDTLRELRNAWARADSSSHVHTFFDMHDLGDALVRAGFAAPVLDVQNYTLYYRDLQQLFADLKHTGERHAARDRNKGLTSPRKLAAMQAAYEPLRRDGRLPVSYEVVFAHAWMPATPRRAGAAADADAATVSLTEIKRLLQGRRTP